MNPLQTLFDAAELALSAYSNDQATVATDQQKITDLQAKLAADQQTALNDGSDAYSKVAALRDAINDLLAKLPAPPAPSA
jgi:hypothetical protein